MLSTNVTSSPGKEWGLYCRLPAGFYATLLQHKKRHCKGKPLTGVRAPDELPFSAVYTLIHINFVSKAGNQLYPLGSCFSELKLA